VKTLVLLALLGAGDFTRLADDDGLVLEGRPVPGSAFAELRVTTITQGDVATLCARAFGTGEFDPAEPHLVARTVLSEGANERVTLEEVQAPAISPRDSVVRRTRTFLPGGVCRVEFRADPGAGPPPKSGVVRIEVLRGSFTFTPLGGGRVKVEHRVHTDPGGVLAPFIVEPARREAAVASVRRLLKPKGT